MFLLHVPLPPYHYSMNNNILLLNTHLRDPLCGVDYIALVWTSYIRFAHIPRTLKFSCTDFYTTKRVLNKQTGCLKNCLVLVFMFVLRFKKCKLILTLYYYRHTITKLL